MDGHISTVYTPSYRFEGQGVILEQNVRAIILPKVIQKICDFKSYLDAIFKVQKPLRTLFVGRPLCTQNWTGYK